MIENEISYIEGVNMISRQVHVTRLEWEEEIHFIIILELVRKL